jgi:hypothetical protein
MSFKIVKGMLATHKNVFVYSKSNARQLLFNSMRFCILVVIFLLLFFMTLFPTKTAEESTLEDVNHSLHFKLMQALREEIVSLKNEIRVLQARVDEQKYLLAYHEQCRIHTLY